ncbi:hypothetical protein COEREDRAFT_87942 [Coemansia reversa NRRL 1564]|uniref:F-box domain-containing protein n=1 Tax=Coemansia reversa (strain ATCC 12441 / NRRL 1564) TaxID=763665 RepID=A0A2G5B8J1_COERN|nr:hypothetical protein COEREDRAFT_87942 [Coemansia reversa NRRL 1564]|eukprot:PIA15325.1 hypothetical protein COEREDRAFT_87942 [Coemansia reversa NRRL 1564]
MDLTLQNLPKHLVQRIAYRAAQWRKIDIYDGYASVGNPAWKMQKYLVLSQGWYTSCIPLYCQEVLLTSNKRMEIGKQEYWQSSIKDISECEGFRFTRYAHLHMSCRSITGGVMEEILNQNQYRVTFPMVEVVLLKLSSSWIDMPALEEKICKQNIVTFCQMIRKIFPNAHIASVTSMVTPGSGENQDTEAKSSQDHVGFLFSEFMRGMRGVQYFSLGCHIFQHLDISNLTSITYSECSNVGCFLQLVRANAKSLQTLLLDHRDPEMLIRLVSDDIQYSQLTKFASSCIDPLPTLFRPRPLAESIFPNLRKLELEQTYPFANDIVFRGNYHLLEHLSLKLSMSDVLSLGQQGVFRSNQFPCVRHLELIISLKNQPYDRDLGRRVSAIPLQIAPNVRYLQINLPGFVYKDALIEQLEGSRARANIKYLLIGYVTFTMDEIVRLLSLLPNIAQLVIDPDTLSIGGNNTLRDYRALNSLESRCFPLAPKLRQIVFEMATGSDMESAAHYALVLAIVCFRVSCVRWTSYSSQFVDHCTALVASERYGKYADRLELVDWEKGR